TRQDWKQHVPNGISEVRGSFVATVASRGQTRFGSIWVADGVVRRRHLLERGRRLETTILGRIAGDEQNIESPIGCLRIRGVHGSAAWSTRRSAPASNAAGPGPDVQPAPVGQGQAAACVTEGSETFAVRLVRPGGTSSPRSSDRLVSIDIKLSLLQSD